MSSDEKQQAATTTTTAAAATTAPDAKDESVAGAAAAAEPAKKELVKVNAPDKEKYEKESVRLTKEMEKLEKEIATFTKEADTSRAVRQTCRNERGELIAKLKASKQARDVLYKERDHFQEEIAKIDTERKERRDAVSNLKSKLSYVTVGEINDAIERIQYKMSTSTVTLKREKAMMAEMKSLESQKLLVQDYVDAKKKSEEDQSDSSEFKVKRDEKRKELKTLRAAEAKLQVVLAELSNKETEANNIMQANTQKRRALGAKLRDLKKELANMKYEYVRQDRAYERYKEEVKFLKRQEARKQRAAQNAEYKKEMQAQQAEEADRHPYENELMVCDELLRYLQRLAPQTDAPTGADSSSAPVAATTLANERASAFGGGKQMQAFQKKKDDDENFFASVVQQKKKKGKKRAQKKASMDVLTHIPEVFSQFERLGLTPPLNREAVAGSVKQLNEKQEYYKTAPPPLSKAEKKAAKDKATAAAKKAAKKDSDKNDDDNNNSSGGGGGDAKLAPDQKARVEQLEKENQAADDMAKVLRAAGRRKSLAMLEEEQARRVSEIEQIQRDADEEMQRERAANKAAAVNAMEEEQKRRVAEYNDDGGAKKERDENVNKARDAFAEEQRRRVEEEARLQEESDAEERSERQKSRRMSIDMAEQERARRIAASATAVKTD